MVIFSIISVFFVVACAPPSLDSVDDLGLSWLPTGRYSHITHVDLGAIPTVTVRSARQVAEPNPAMEKLLTAAAG